jgi:ATP-binding cassette subfamily B protein
LAVGDFILPLFIFMLGSKDMSKELISKQAVVMVLQDYWRRYTAFPVRSFFMFVLPAVGTILVFYVPPLIAAKIIDLFATTGTISLSLSIKYIILFGVLWFAGELCWRIGEHFMIRIKRDGVLYLNQISFKRLADRDYSFYSNNFVGSLTKKAIAYAKSFESFTDTLVFELISNLTPIVFAVIILSRYGYGLPVALLGGLAVACTLVFPLIRRRARLVAARHNENSVLTGRLSDAMTNMLAIKSFAKEKPEYEFYSKQAERYADAYQAAADYNNLRMNMLLSPLFVATNTVGLVLSIVLANRLSLEPGMIFVVFSYFSQVTRIFWYINGIYRNIENSIGEAAELNQLFIKPPLVSDQKNASALSVGDGEIIFSRVGFGYGKAEDSDMFLRDFSLTIKPNQKVGLVGPSGSGKTTITKLILRFLDVREGEILIDGQAINTVTQESLRESIAYVPQEPLLFHRSLYENISYGNEAASREEVFEAARMAHAHEFIESLPKGYDTLVGERGIKLSGGQRQRVAIARALLKKSPILVLDEATSALDSESEKYIQEGLFRLMENKTAVVIAHRLSTIKHLDRIVVLDQGSVVEDGTHDELVAKNGLYAKLWSHQSGEFF